MEIVDISAQEGFVTFWGDVFHMQSLHWHPSNQIFAGNFVPDSRGMWISTEERSWKKAKGVHGKLEMSEPT